MSLNLKKRKAIKIEKKTKIRKKKVRSITAVKIIQLVKEKSKINNKDNKLN